MDRSPEGVQGLSESRRWLCDLKRGSPGSVWVCVGQQGINVFGRACERLRDRLCPACEEGEFTYFQYGWKEPFELGIRRLRARASGSNLIHGGVEIMRGIVNWPPAVGGAPGRTVAAHSEENALGAGLEGNLTDSTNRVLPKCDYRDRVEAVRAGGSVAPYRTK
jgi:hypothetical protein